MLEIDRSQAKKFLQACQNGDLEKVKALVDDNCIKDWTVYRHEITGDTALHVAAREGHVQIVRYLCNNWPELDCKVNVANFDMKTPLHEAAQFARSDVLDFLLEQGAHIDCLKRADWTPLMLACTKENIEAQKCIEKLLQRGANMSLKNKDGWTPFLVACRTGDPLIISQLLKHSPDCINDKSNNKRTSLHIAAFHSCLNALSIILGAKSDLLESRDSSGSTPLHESVKSLNLDVVHYLIAQEADIKAVDNMGQNLLHIAASVGNTEMIEYILANDMFEIDSKANFGITALQIAERNRQNDAVQILTRNSAKR